MKVRNIVTSKDIKRQGDATLNNCLTDEIVPSADADPGKKKRQGRPSYDKRWRGRRGDSGEGHGRRARHDGARGGKVVSANVESRSRASSAEEGHQPPSAITDLAGSIRRIPNGTYNTAGRLPEDIEIQIAVIESTRETISGSD